jgi:tetratricopeptide (TPR) repeat protein
MKIFHILLLSCFILTISVSAGFSKTTIVERNTLADINIKNEQAISLASQGNYQSANEIFLEVLDQSERILGNQHADISYIHQNLGITFWRLGDFERGLQHFNQALVIQKNSLVKRVWLSQKHCNFRAACMMNGESQI